MRRLLSRKQVRFSVGAFFIVFFLYVVFFAPPRLFPKGQVITIPEGEPAGAVAARLRSENFIRNRLLFKSVSVLFGDENIQAGSYYFPERATLVTILRRLHNGDFGITPHRITIPEGVNNREIADILGNIFPSFEKELFLLLARDKEGYLFPDTYYFSPNVSPGEVVKIMHENFLTKTETLKEDAQNSERTFSDIVVMASLLEKEAHKEHDRKRIAGVLWKRLDANMALQVDAVFLYIFGKASHELTKDDLNIDSPYNTYRYPGLPAGPIANPGLLALEAALHYEKNPYWYYLSDAHGNLYYAEDFEGHKANRIKYLN